MQKGEGKLELVAALNALLAMLFPAGRFPKSEVGGSGLEVEVDQFDDVAIGEAGGEVLGAILWFEERFLNATAKNDSAKVILVVAVVASPAVEGVGELLEEVGVWHLLDKDDVGLPGFEGGGERAIVAGPIAGDDAQGVAVKIGLGLPCFGGLLSQPDEGGGFIGKNENGDEPSGGGKKREGGAEEKVSDEREGEP